MLILFILGFSFCLISFHIGSKTGTFLKTFLKIIGLYFLLLIPFAFLGAFFGAFKSSYGFAVVSPYIVGFYIILIMKIGAFPIITGIAGVLWGRIEPNLEPYPELSQEENKNKAE